MPAHDSRAAWASPVGRTGRAAAETAKRRFYSACGGRQIFRLRRRARFTAFARARIV